MPAMWVMKVAIDEIIQMVPMRDAFVTATGPVLMFRLMSLTLMLGCAALRDWLK